MTTDVDPKMAESMVSSQMTKLFSDDDSKQDSEGFDTSSLLNKIVSQASKKLDGIDPVLPELLVAVITKNKEMLVESLGTLGQKVGVDP